MIDDLFDLEQFIQKIDWKIPDDVSDAEKKDLLVMQLAIFEAISAFLDDEVPVGCIIVKDGKILAREKNKRERTNSPIAHAEILALETAAQELGSWRLEGCTVYVSLEPCPMCMGALLQARVKRLVYAAGDKKAGAAGTLLNLHQDSRLNHQIEVKSGCMEKASAYLLQEFFKKKRAKGKNGKK